MNVINFLPTSPRAHPPSSFPPPLKQISPKVAIFITSRPNPKAALFSITTTHCSTKPNANINSSDSEQDQNSTKSQPSSDENPSSPPPPPSSSPSSSSSSSSSQSLSFSRGLVLDLGPDGSWDSAEVGSPVVKRFLSDDEERWFMWYHGRSGNLLDGKDSIGLAVSSNGAHWERAGRSPEHAGLVMKCSEDWWAFDTTGIRPCEVVVMSSTKVRASSAVYWLYYTGYSSERVNHSEDSLGFNLENPERVLCNGLDSDKGSIFRSLPGLAMSQDGRHWARIEGDHHSGAVFDVGDENEWDSLYVSSPKVVFHSKGDLRMYYHSFDKETGEFCLGLARSRDGIKWVKLGKVLGGRRGCFDEYGAVNAHVVRDRKDGKYLMVYEGFDQNGGRSIGFAVSSDGLKEWTRPSEVPVLRALEGSDSWDSVGVGCPYLVQMEGEEDEWRLYYRGVGSEGRTGIGMAVSEGKELRSLSRWTGFHI